MFKPRIKDPAIKPIYFAGPSGSASPFPSSLSTKRHIIVRAILCVAFALGCAASARAVSAAPLTSLAAVHALSHAEAAQGLPVAFEASVTYYRKGNVDLFVQDGDVAIYVETVMNANLIPGDRVLVIGKTRDSFRPEILSESVTLLHHGAAPDPVTAAFRQLIRAELDCRRVTLRAVVRSANLVSDVRLKNVYLQLLMDGGNIDAEVVSGDASVLRDLLDSEIEVTGAVAGTYAASSNGFTPTST
jgi:hypothetical protein